MSDRPVFTDALHTVGSIIGPNEKRDAVHFAVEPVIAGHDLVRADRVGRLPDGSYGYKAPMDKINVVGIVDPFLEGTVKRGERFWLFLNPRTITSLRHVWDHPDFPVVEHTEDLIEASDDKGDFDLVATSEQWMRDYAASLSNEGGKWDDDYAQIVTAEELIREGKKHIEQDWHYYSRGGLFEGVGLSDEYWFHLSVITGLEIPEDKQENFFSCAC